MKKNFLFFGSYIGINFLLIALIATATQPFQHHRSLASPVSTDTTHVTLQFVGDIMQHGSQRRAAMLEDTTKFNYKSCFELVADELKEADFTIANLELTLAGEPYTSYPTFSAPDKLVQDLVYSGVNVMATANNHSYDKGKKGLIRTLDVLDSLKILRAGTYRDTTEYLNSTPLILQKDSIRLALLNYTFSTNGIRVRPPNVVCAIDTAQILRDIHKSKASNVDAIIAFMHWGDEYTDQPNSYQKSISRLLHQKGIDYVIGAHPHVLQPMETFNDSTKAKKQVTVYSLGNFVAGQANEKRMGAIFRMKLQKIDHKLELSECGYILTWIDKPYKNGKRLYQVVPVDKVKTTPKSPRALYTKKYRHFFQKYNKGVFEYMYDTIDSKWVLTQADSSLDL
ncbi:CapA family protein [Limibacter armeniacum]|uniref:CapA family protein n=1 Tax=Limibacter armeniacum TaxID=466084 RepID=UPI002FE68FDE